MGFSAHTDMRSAIFFRIFVLIGFLFLGLFSFAHASSSPVISSVGNVPATTTSTVITWTTDVPGTSQVIFIDSGDGQPYKRYPEPLDSNLTTEHSVAVTDLVPSTTYAYYVASADGSGDIMSSSASSTTFVTAPVNASSSPDFRVDTVGGHTVYAGSDLYYGFATVKLGGMINGPFFPTYVIAGLPSSISAHVICAYNPNPSDETADNNFLNGKESCGGGVGSIRLRTASGTPVGAYTATITFRVGTLDRTYAYPFHVLPAPAPIFKQAISSVPPIPGLAKWESLMTSVGKKWCDGKTYGFGYEGDVWYYDGGRVYMQVGDYTHDVTAWLPCAENVLKQYEDYVNTNQGGIPAWRKFPAGAAMHYWRYGDDASKQAVINLYNSVSTPYVNAAAPVWGTMTDPNAIRELAYGIESMVYGEEIGQPRSPFLARAVNGALAQYDQLSTSDPWRFDQPAFDGLMARALIKYYDLTKDPRIPPTIKNMLDWMWTNGVNHETGAVVYNPLYVPSYALNNLTNLLAPAYAWYWNISGDSIYQQEGDFIFSHALDDDITFSGKIYSQNYAWSFDYVRYRSGNPLSATDPADPANARVSNSSIPVPLSPSSTVTIPPVSVAFTRNLALGMTGNDVKQLQFFLITKNEGPSARKLSVHGTTQYFGTLTQGALAEFQKSVHISPASGFFGPITRAWVAAHP